MGVRPRFECSVAPAQKLEESLTVGGRMTRARVLGSDYGSRSVGGIALTCAADPKSGNSYV
jgi:hypothetical protein